MNAPLKGSSILEKASVLVNSRREEGRDPTSTPTWLVVLAVLFFAYYVFHGWDRPSGWHSGAHWALIQAMGEDGSFEISAYRGPAGDDVALRNGKYYSAKEPGTAFLALPFYRLARCMSRGRPGDASERYVASRVPVALAGAGCLFLMGLLLLEAGLPGSWTRAVLLAWGLGSLASKYSVDLFFHVPSSFFLLLTFWSMVRICSREGRAIHWLGLGIGTSWALSVLEVNAIILPVVATFVLFRRPERRAIAFLAIGFASGGIPFAIYQWSCFGSPWSTSYPYHVLVNHVKDTHGLPSNPLRLVLDPDWTKIRHLLLSTQNDPRVGLLPLMPVVALAPAGIVQEDLKRRGAALVLALVILWSYLAFVSTLRNTFGGGTNDARYLTEVSFFLYLYAWFAWAVEWRRWTRPAVRWTMVVMGAAVLIWQVLVNGYFRFINADRYWGDFLDAILTARRLEDWAREVPGYGWSGTGWFWVFLALIIAFQRTIRRHYDRASRELRDSTRIG